MEEIKVSDGNIGECIKIILVKKNMNIANLAELMGVSSTTLYSKFKKDVFSFKDLDRISDVLNLSYDLTFTIKDWSLLSAEHVLILLFRQNKPGIRPGLFCHHHLICFSAAIFICFQTNGYFRLFYIILN